MHTDKINYPAHQTTQVANPHVRANAATLLLDAFPLQDPDSTREDIDQIMQKQFDAMMVCNVHPSYYSQSVSLEG